MPHCVTPGCLSLHILVSAAISSLPSAVLIVSCTCSPLPPAGIVAEMRFPFFGSAFTRVVEQYRVAAFQRYAQRRGRFDAEELKIHARTPRPRD